MSVALAPSLDTPEHIRLAEDLGFERAWLYDAAHQSHEVWMTLALAAQQTHRIGLGPAVLVPTLRHPIVTASAAIALEQLVPGRLVVAFGTGLAPRVLGQRRSVPWSYVQRYVDAFRALLGGEVVEWDGGKMKMFDADESVQFSPIEVPVYIAAIGPKGLAIARDRADALFVVGTVPVEASEFDDVAYLVSGTVMEEHETATDDRVRRAAGPGLMALHHGSFAFYGDDFVASLPGGQQWLDRVRRLPEDERHFMAYRGHYMYLNEADQAAWEAGAHAALRDLTITGTTEEVRAKVDSYRSQGVTELVYQPIGDIENELRRFIAAVQD